MTKRGSAPAPAPPARGPAKPAPSQPEPAQPDGGGLSGLQIGGIIVGSAGLVAGIVGFAFGGVALSDKNSADDFCNEQNVCSQQGLDLRDSGLTAATVSTVGVAVGGALVAAGTVMLIVGGGDDDEPAASVGFSPLPGGGALVLGGRF